jgi:hypothetical protein
MVLAAGFPAPEIAFNQPVVARGENKRFLELSVAEAGPAFIDAGLITAEVLDRTLAEMRRVNADGRSGRDAAHEPGVGAEAGSSTTGGALRPLGRGVRGAARQRQVSNHK